MDKIIRKLIPDYGSVENPAVRTKYGILEGWVSIGLNGILSIFKFIFGIFFNSIALITDAVHTLSDVITSIIVVLGFKISSRPPDKNHPFGHGRMESISTLIIGVLLVVVGINFANSAYQRIRNPEVVGSNLWVIILMLIFAGIKELLARFAIQIGKKTNSDTIIADAWHHRSDAIATLLVAISFFSVSKGYYYVDAILGFLIALLIVYVGIKFIIKPIIVLLGEASSAEKTEEIKKIAFSVPEVKNVHEILIHDYGEKKVISLHIVVDKKIGLLKAHEIASKVEEKINKATSAHVTVHIDPGENVP